MRAWLGPLSVVAACGGEEPRGSASFGVEAVFEAGRTVVRSPGAAEVSLALLGFGPVGHVSPAAVVAPGVEGGRTVFVRPAVVEWWEQGPRGLEHGFTVAHPPDEGEVVFELGLGGAVADIDPDGLGATFEPEDGAPVRYEGLLAWDARGIELPSRMEATDAGLRLVVDVTGAEGALTVDPLFPGSGWSSESNHLAARLGASVASAGDVNGDGYADLLAGAPFWANGNSREGVAQLWFGGAGGPGAAPQWSAEGNLDTAQLGETVASAGDVNGDGYDDVVVGSTTYDQTHGRAFVWLGSRTGPRVGAADWTQGHAQVWSGQGGSFASGDVNGDGFDDLVVGASGADRGQLNEGTAALYLGSAAGLRTVSAWLGELDQSAAQYGETLATADVNGDGFADVLVAAPWYDTQGGPLGQQGWVGLYLGSAAGLSATPSWTASSVQNNGRLGYGLASAGDVDGDGYEDVLVGAPGEDGNLGRAYLYRGSAAGLETAPAWSSAAVATPCRFAEVVAGLGDVNGDGYADVGVGAAYQSHPEQREGRVFVYLGGPAGLSAAPAVAVESNSVQAVFGAALAGAGDVNGDGHDDLLVGAPTHTAGQNQEGAVILYYGR